MKDYGSGGTATREKNACGFRLLAVAPEYRQLGLGKLLTQHCIDLGSALQKKILIIHTTNAMKLAWKMYEEFGYERFVALDFKQGHLQVYGFKLNLESFSKDSIGKV